MIIALARPRTVDISSQTKTTKGIDIVLAIDVSGSMLAKDLKPNRMEALKRVAADFVGERPNDRVGLVLYASEAYTKTPVTSDKAIILEAIKGIKIITLLFALLSLRRFTAVANPIPIPVPSCKTIRNKSIYDWNWYKRNGGITICLCTKRRFFV